MKISHIFTALAAITVAVFIWTGNAQAQYNTRRKPANAAARTAQQPAKTSATETKAVASAPNTDPKLQSRISATEAKIVKRRLSRTEEREARHQHFIAGLDTLVSSRMFQFVPISMQEQPGGNMQMIYNFYYYVGVIKDKVEVHIPTIRGFVAEYIDILNFNSSIVKDYKATKTLVGWNISFITVAPNGTSFTFTINLYTSTGEAVLNLITPINTIKYTGTIEGI